MFPKTLCHNKLRKASAKVSHNFLMTIILFVSLTALYHFMNPFTQPLDEALEYVETTLPKSAIAYRCLNERQNNKDIHQILPLTYKKDAMEMTISVDMDVCSRTQLFAEPDMLSEFLKEAGRLTKRRDIDQIHVYLKTKEGYLVEFHEPDILTIEKK